MRVLPNRQRFVTRVLIVCELEGNLLQLNSNIAVAVSYLPRRKAFIAKAWLTIDQEMAGYARVVLLRLTGQRVFEGVVRIGIGPVRFGDTSPTLRTADLDTTTWERKIGEGHGLPLCQYVYAPQSPLQEPLHRANRTTGKHPVCPTFQSSIFAPGRSGLASLPRVAVVRK
jgi:hypothetical protein